MINMINYHPNILHGRIHCLKSNLLYLFAVDYTYVINKKQTNTFCCFY